MTPNFLYISLRLFSHLQLLKDHGTSYCTVKIPLFEVHLSVFLTQILFCEVQIPLSEVQFLLSEVTLKSAQYIMEYM